MNDELNSEKDVLSIKIPTFPGPNFPSNPKAAFPTWSAQLIGAAMDAGPGATGHAGLVLTAEAFHERFGHDFAPRLDPGTEPRPNTSDWKAQFAAFNREQRFIKLFRNKMMNAIDLVAQTMVGTPDELITMHPRAILSSLISHYGTVSATELTEELAKLTIPISDPEEWAPLLGLHMTVHRLHVRNHQALGEHQKIELMKAALAPIGHFDAAIAKFEDDRPLGHVERNFMSFVTKMGIAHSLIRSDKPHTAADLFKRKADGDPNNFVRSKYAGSANQLEPSSLIPTKSNIGSSDLEELKAFMVKEVKALMNTSKKPPSHYCWTHGIGNHDSKSCKFPKLGHVTTATAKSKSGGSDHVHKKRKT